MTKEIRINGFAMNCAGHLSPGLWRHPRDRSANYHDLDYWTDLARTLERGKLDAELKSANDRIASIELDLAAAQKKLNLGKKQLAAAKASLDAQDAALAVQAKQLEDAIAQMQALPTVLAPIVRIRKEELS